MPRKEPIAALGTEESNLLFDDICDRLDILYHDFDEERLRHAYGLALTAHDGQIRLDGTPYIMHPLEVAEACAELNMEENAVIAALLHDTVEDTAVRLNQIRQLFGHDVANIVDALTKIKRIDFFVRFTGRNKASNQARNLQKLFVAMTRDTRVIVIKLADRLHNMKTLASMPRDKQLRISRETLEFYIPIARRLGLGEVVRELEDLVFRYLFPAEYDVLKDQVQAIFAKEEHLTEKMVGELTRVLRDEGVAVKRIYHRRKHLFSIYQKMQKQHVGLDGVYDLLAIRIIVSGTPQDCYRVLGLVHLHYKPIFHRFRDYIASPKENGYQTLHTTVIGPSGIRAELQIRTEEMELDAAKGIAAHWRYKEAKGRPEHLIKDEAWLQFIRELSEEDINSEEFVARTRDSLLGDQVLVLSPKGEVVNLPQGSTPIDFAYYIHTELGHAIRSANVNGMTVPLDYELRTGDLVEVIKAEEPDAPPRPEWLVLAKSPKSLLKIRRYFRSRPRAERIEAGRRLLRQHIVKEGLYPLNLTANDKLVALLRRLPVRSIDDLYDKVALGYFQCAEIVGQLKEIHLARVDPVAEAKRDGDFHPHLALVGFAGDLGLELAGGQPLRRKAEIMRCCTPVPGDRIYGLYDRQERRVHVHRLECGVLTHEVGSGELMELSWSREREDKRYPARILLVSLNRVGLLFEVLRYLSTQNINLGGAEFAMTPTVIGPDANARTELIIEVADSQELEQCMAALRKLDDVFDVKRLIKLSSAADEEHH